VHSTVFRAEDSNTHRHLTEFTGLDLEMTIEESYEEVVDLLDSLFLHIFKGLQETFKREIEQIGKNFPADPFLWKEKTIRLKWVEAMKLLAEAGVKNGEFDDMRWACFRGLNVCISTDKGSPQHGKRTVARKTRSGKVSNRLLHPR
jgi:aspartyl/asparaginyl-tRNA synthetase